MTTQRSRHLQSELRRRSAPLSLVADPIPSSTSRVGARSWAGSEQWCRCHVPRSLPQEANLAAHPAPYRRTILARGCVLSATRSPWPLPNHLPRRRPSPNRHLCWPSTARASFERQAPTRADHEPVVDAAGDHADPGHPSRAAACPPPRCMTSLRPDTADAGTHGHRTPDTGHRTADTWTLRRPHRTLDTGRLDRHAWTLVARTGHWTPDAGRGHRQGDEGTAGSRTSWATTPSDPAGTPKPCSCGRRLRCPSAHGGSAVRPPSSAR
jgi:hypothetical protein